jgi:hypothetical protein
VDYQCSLCGDFCLERDDDEDSLQNEKWRSKNSPKKIGALLAERHLQALPAAFLLFRDYRPSNLGGSTPIRVSELLAAWPDSVPERIERSFLTLARRIGVGIAGKKAQIGHTDLKDYVPLAIHEHEDMYFLDSMQEYGWIRQVLVSNSRTVAVTPQGWERFDELTRTHSSKNNPAFVAMWFGGDDPVEQDRMRRLFDESIKAVCNKLGWLAERVDSEEHNDSIMDRIIAMIRRAPFAIADLSDDNRGVYYEAGFARGIGCDVVYLAREGAKVHFDLSGVNHVKWSSVEDLRAKLENRILGTMGRGPHKLMNSGVVRPWAAGAGASDDNR